MRLHIVEKILYLRSSYLTQDHNSFTKPQHQSIAQLHILPQYMGLTFQTFQENNYLCYKTPDCDETRQKHDEKKSKLENHKLFWRLMTLVFLKESYSLVQLEMLKNAQVLVSKS